MAPHPAHASFEEQSTRGERIADAVTNGMGTVRFICWQAALTVMWVTLNSLHGWSLYWDSYPYILLNLLYSLQAGFTGPLVLLSQNRQAERDRMKAEHDYLMDFETRQIVQLLAENRGITIPQELMSSLEETSL